MRLTRNPALMGAFAVASSAAQQRMAEVLDVVVERVRRRGPTQASWGDKPPATGAREQARRLRQLQGKKP